MQLLCLMSLSLSNIKIKKLGIDVLLAQFVHNKSGGCKVTLICCVGNALMQVVLKVF